MPPTLQVKLLGEWSMTYGDRAVAEINTARSQVLLAYLILYHHSPSLDNGLPFTSGQTQPKPRRERTFAKN
jgi:hypothetical protein